MADETKKPQDLDRETLRKLFEALGGKPEAAEGETLLKKMLGGTTPTLTRDQWIELLRNLTQTEIQKKAASTNIVDNVVANAWFAEHWPEPRKCSVCQQQNWAMAPRFAQIPMGPIGLHQPLPNLPCVVVTCQTCGNTIFFNALVMALLPKEQR